MCHDSNGYGWAALLTTPEWYPMRLKDVINENNLNVLFVVNVWDANMGCILVIKITQKEQIRYCFFLLIVYCIMKTKITGELHCWQTAEWYPMRLKMKILSLDSWWEFQSNFKNYMRFFGHNRLSQ